MDSTPGLSSRERVLTNSAAEFLETHGEFAVGSEIAEVSPEFVPELDRFVAPKDFPSLDYHEKSRERLEQFKRTLDAFQQNLIDRKVDTRFDITIKHVHEYTFQDVLQIANKVQQKNKKLDNVHKCTRAIKTFFRGTGKNAPTLKKLLAFVPSDTYGSVICGGFTVILGALERTETLRDTMYSTLEKIPQILKKVHDWLDVHHQSITLKFEADAILVDIFVILELIVRELSGSTIKKIIKVPFKGESYGSNIDKAIASLQESVERFEGEAKICSEQRLGEIDVVTKNTLRATRQVDERTTRTELKVQQIAEDVADIRGFAAQCRLHEASLRKKLTSNDEKEPGKPEGKELSTEVHGVQVYNYLYSLFASSGCFDSKTGRRELSCADTLVLQELTSDQVDLYQAQRQPLRTDRTRTVLGRPSIPKDWSKASRKICRIAVGDLAECFRDMGSKPDHIEQNRIAFILVSEEVRTYLHSSASKLLVVELPSDADGYFTPASYASTVLIRAVQKIGTFPVLYYSCVPRTSDPNPKHAMFADGRGILASLVSQLLQYSDHLRGVDLDFLSARGNRFKRIIDDSEQLLLLLEELLRQIPKSTCVYIVIDGVWKLQNNNSQSSLDGLLELLHDKDLFIKLLVTSPFSLDILNPLKREEAKQRKRAKKAGATVPPESALVSLYVLEHVDGGHHDFNTNWIEEEVGQVLRGCPDSSETSSDSHTERRTKKKSNHKGKEKKRRGDLSSHSDTSGSGSDDTASSGYAQSE